MVRQLILPIVLPFSREEAAHNERMVEKIRPLLSDVEKERLRKVCARRGKGVQRKKWITVP